MTNLRVNNILGNTSTTIEINSNIEFDSNSHVVLPRGTTAQRPSNVSAGSIRYNTETKELEYFNGTDWITLNSINSNFYVPVTDGLTLHLDAGNSLSYPGTGTLWRDLSPYGQIGTMSSGVTYDNQDGLGSMIFNGNGGLVIFPHNDELQNNESISICAWVKPTDYYNTAVGQENMNIVGKHDNTGYRFRISDGDKTATFPVPGKVVLFDRGSINNISTEPYVIDINKWNFITVIMSKVGLKIYVKDELKSRNKIPFEGFTATQRLVIGGANDTTSLGEYFYGKISLLLFYTKALTGDEVKKIYGATRQRFLD